MRLDQPVQGCSYFERNSYLRDEVIAGEGISDEIPTSENRSRAWEQPAYRCGCRYTGRYI
jgi:hypothetical protein